MITRKNVQRFTLFTSLLGLTVSPLWAQSSAKKQLPLSLKKKVMNEKAFDFDSLQSPFASWGVDPKNKLSSINLANAWKKFSPKKEVVVAVIDTGIDLNHPFLKKNVHVSHGKRSGQNFGVDFSKSRKDKFRPFDTHGHGTHVAGIIKSVFPKVKILSLKYYNPKASGRENLESTIAALRYAVSQNVDVINYSGGGPEPALEELKVLKEAEKKGILVVAAAGNEESNIDIRTNAYYPASYKLKNIITVTAHDQNLKILNSSNWGKKSVDISAPGYRIRSSLPNGRSGYLTGTSQATAFVSGVSAFLMAENPDLSAAEIKELIKSSAKKEIRLLSKCASGGRLDVEKAQTLTRRYIKARKNKRSLAQQKRKSTGKIIYRLNN
jgi:subtilisin family serine protease